METGLWIIVGMLVAVFATVAAVVARTITRRQSELGTAVRDELRQGREDSSKASRELREELANGLSRAQEQLASTLLTTSGFQKTEIEAVSGHIRDLVGTTTTALERSMEIIDTRLGGFQEVVGTRLDAIRQIADERLTTAISTGQKATLDTLSEMGKLHRDQLDAVSGHVRDLAGTTTTALERSRETIDTRLGGFQEIVGARLDEIRRTADEKLTMAIDTGQKSMLETLSEMGRLQREQLETMSGQIREIADSNRGSLDRIRETVDLRVKELQDGNDRKLEEMRKTVDEKLHETLERRLGDSFNVVSERLEAVQRGLGEMQSLANGVGDLRRVLTNVKARGTWAEVQLGAILAQILAPNQFERNVRVRDDSDQAVEYAIRIPRHGDGGCMWLPIDSKFPQEDYGRLQEAADHADAEAVQRATESLNRALRVAAQDIRTKYVNPPDTTDFAILYLATEGLYAEVVRQPALVEELHQRYRIVPAGPTTLAAILSSLRMGFQTIAVEQRAAEVRATLAAVKTEFAKFGDVLDRVKRQLRAASNSIEATGVRTRAMERKLRSVEELSEEDASRVLALPSVVAEIQDEEMDLVEQLVQADEIPF
jgi:DNA recombination protein RmuC